jgi:hypothetical protein
MTRFRMPTAVENWSDKAAQAFDNQDFAMTIRYCIKALSLDPAFATARNLKMIAEQRSAIALLKQALLHIPFLHF